MSYTTLDEKTARKFVRKQNAIANDRGRAITLSQPLTGSRIAQLRQFEALYRKALPITLGVSKEKRKVHVFGVQPCTDGARVFSYTLAMRSSGPDQWVVCAAHITEHALARILERRREVNLIDALRNELDERFGYGVFRSELDNKLIGPDIRIGTTTGQFRGIVEDGVAILKTWLPNRLLHADELLSPGDSEVALPAAGYAENIHKEK